MSEGPDQSSSPLEKGQRGYASDPAPVDQLPVVPSGPAPGSGDAESTRSDEFATGGPAEQNARSSASPKDAPNT